MALQSKTGISGFKLNGSTATPIEWQDVEITATFDDDAVQANISTEQFTFTLEDSARIREYIQDGMTGLSDGIFQGMPFSMEVANNTSKYTAFDGFLDLTNDFVDDYSNNRVKAKIKRLNGLNWLNDRLEALTFSYLLEKKAFSSSDYSTKYYVVERNVALMEIAIALLLINTLRSEIQRAYKEVEKAVNTVAHATGGVPTGPLAAVIYQTAVAIISIAFITAMLYIVVDTTINILSLLIPPRRTAKVLKAKTGLINIFKYLGYTFQSNIQDLDKIYYIPSNPEYDVESPKGLLDKYSGPLKGIPNTYDYGYNCADFVALFKKMFNAQIAIIGNTLYFHTKKDPFWIKQSEYKMASVLNKPIRYNTDELKGTVLVKFDTDLNDEWTIQDYNGTNCEINTSYITSSNDRADFIKGYDEVSLSVCLATNKSSFTALEVILQEVVNIASSLINKFGGDSSMLTGLFQNKIGLMKVWTNNWQKPKALKYIGNSDKLESKANWGAKYLWDNYHNERSFVANSFYGQKYVFKEIKVPFGFNDYLSLIENSYFTDSEGSICKATSFRWRIDSQYAIISYYTRKPYTKNLKETIFEA